MESVGAPAHYRTDGDKGHGNVGPRIRAWLLRLIRVRSILPIIVASLLVGLSMAVGRDFFDEGLSFAMGPSFVPTFCSAAGRAFLVLLAISIAYDAWGARIQDRAEKREGSPTHAWVHFALLLVLVIALLVPAFMATYPGWYSSDGPDQVAQALNTGALADNQPALHSLVMWGTFSLGKTFFGSYSAGLVIYGVLQGLLLAFALAFSGSRLVRWGVPAAPVYIAAAFVASNPVFQIYAFTTTKDSLFAAPLVLLVALLAEYMRDMGGASRSWGRAVGVVACTALVCLLRKQGVAVVALLALLALVHGLRRERTYLTRLLLPGSLVAGVVLALAFDAIVPTLVPKGSPYFYEAFSVPAQQIVRVYDYDRGSMSREELAEFDTYFNQTEQTEVYLWPISDYARLSLDSAALKNDLPGFFSFWVELGTTHPAEYLSAYVGLTIGQVFPSIETVTKWSGPSPWNERESLIKEVGPGDQVKFASLLPDYFLYLHYTTTYYFPDSPFFTFFVCVAFPFYMLLASGVLLVRSRRHDLLLAWGLPALYWLTLMVATTVSCLRFVFPVGACAAFLLLLPLVPDDRALPGPRVAKGAIGREQEEMSNESDLQASYSVD